MVAPVQSLPCSSVCAQELHTLEVTSQVTQIKARGASLEDIALEHQVVLLAGTSLKDEATIDQHGVEVLTTLEVVGHMLGARVHGFPARAGHVRGQRWPNRRKRRRQAEPSGRCRTTGAWSMSCPPLARRAPMPTLKSVVILTFPDKDI